MEIRPATPDDIPALIAIERDAHTAAHWSGAEYLRLLDPAQGLLLVAEHASVCGFLAARTAGPEWELENIAVATAARGQGVGSALVRRLLALAGQRGAEAVWLEVRESNAAARALYAACGFHENGRRKRYYSDPAEDAVLYQFVICNL